MTDDLAYVERLLDIFDRQHRINDRILQWMDAADQLDTRRADDIQELREGLAALSNRVEALLRATELLRAVTDVPEHSVKVPQ